MSTEMLKDKEAKRNIARYLVRVRLERNMSRYALAKAVDVATIQISRIENGEQMPGAGMLARIAEALGVTSDDLLYGPEKNSQNQG